MNFLEKTWGDCLEEKFKNWKRRKKVCLSGRNVIEYAQYAIQPEPAVVKDLNRKPRAYARCFKMLRQIS